MKKEKNPLLVFLGGLVMLAVGLFWFTNSVTVTSGFFSRGIYIGNMNIKSGMIIVPFIVGIVLLFINFDSIAAKLVTGLGMLIIIAGVIMSTDLHLQTMPLYAWLVMLVFIFGGAALVLKVLLGPVDKNKKDKES